VLITEIHTKPRISTAHASCLSGFNPRWLMQPHTHSCVNTLT